MRGSCAISGLFSIRLTRPWRLAVMVGVGLLFAYLLSWSGIIQTLELATYDLRLWLRGPRRPPPSIVVVAINDESFNAFRQNIRTWDRTQYARLIDLIAAGQPAVIGLDVAWIHSGAGPADEALARSLRRAGNAVLASMIEHQAGAGYEYTRYAAPIDPLAQAAAGVGVVNLPRDNDGVVRQAALWWQHNEAWYPAFAQEVVRVYQRHQPAPVNPPAKTGAGFFINFCGGEATFPTVPMYRVLTGEVAPAIFAGKIVLIGFTTSLEQDLHPTAFNPPWGAPSLIPGVEIHANIIASLLQNNPIRPAPPWLWSGLSLAAVALTGAAFWRLQPIRAAVMVTTAAMVYAVGALLLFIWADLWLPLVAPVGLAAITVTGGLIERVLVEERDKRRLRTRFESFMAPERLSVVLERWEELIAEDRSEITATVLFSDIRGFTSATETLTRQGRSGEVIRFLNRYTDAMVEAIFAEHGVLDKMLGDGLLVLFGAPEPTPNHALRAARAALRMAALLPGLNEIWPLRHLRPLRIGIGIHSGSLMDGIVGRGRRVEYTVIGDAVNTASRIEGYTKEVLARQLAQTGDDGLPGATILITQATYNQIKDYVLVDGDIPPCQAKGKTMPIPVYRVLGLADTPGERL